MKRITRSGVLALFFILVLSGASGMAAAKPVIAIGHLPHFTGAYGATQAAFAPAQEDAIEWANSVNYVPGRRVKLAWGDGGTDTAKSMAVFKKMISETPKPVVIIGESTAIGTALVKMHAHAKVPDVEGGMSQAMINPPTWTFCQPPAYPGQFAAWVDYFLAHIWKKSEPPKFAWLTWDNPFGKSPMTEEAEAYLKSKGIQVVASEFIPDVPSDTTAHVLRLKEPRGGLHVRRHVSIGPRRGPQGHGQTGHDREDHHRHELRLQPGGADSIRGASGQWRVHHGDQHLGGGEAEEMPYGV